MNKIQPPVPDYQSRNPLRRSQWALLPLLLMFVVPVLSQDGQDEQKAPERAIMSTGVDAEAIARKRPDTAVWLTDGDQSRMLALFQPEQDSPAKGALLILSDEGVSAAAGLADSLREPLSRAGWAVMTLGLELPPFAVQQWLRQQSNARPDVEQTGQDAQADDESGVMINLMETGTPSDALNQYRDQVVASLTAAVDALSARDYERIVLAGVGRAAGHVTRQVRKDGRASDLIWIAPYFYADESSSLTELLAAAASPSVLELYSSFAADKALDRSARQRAAALKRAGITGYSQQPAAMARQPQAREAKMLANRISSWLRSTARDR